VAKERGPGGPSTPACSARRSSASSASNTERRRSGGYESLLFPGLLHTEQYAQAIIAADIAVRPIEVDQRVEVRLRRPKSDSAATTRLHLTVVISQAVLTQQIGGPAVLRGQLDHVAKHDRGAPGQP